MHACMQEVERVCRESREQVEDALVERDQAKAREVGTEGQPGRQQQGREGGREGVRQAGVVVWVVTTGADSA